MSAIPPPCGCNKHIMYKKNQHSRITLGKSRLSRYEQGLSLIELLVAVVIGLLMLLAVSAVFIQGRTAGRALEDNQGVQEGARFALDRISYSLRMAKNAGCARGGAGTVGLSARSTNPPTGDDIVNLFEANKVDASDTIRRLLDDRAFIRAYDQGTGFVIPNVTTTLTLPVAGDISLDGLTNLPDALFLAGAKADFRHLSASMTDASAGTIPIKITPGDKLLSNQDVYLLMISDCVRAEIFYGQQNTAGNAISYDNVSNNQADLRKPYSAESTVSEMDVRNYFVAKSSNFTRDGWTLYEQKIMLNGIYRSWGPAQPILSRVSRFNIEFGVDTDNDGLVNIYQKPAAVTDWAKVISARVSLGVLGEQLRTASTTAGSIGRTTQKYTVQVDIRN
jgi:type IV pilus assembly protein PilW